MGFQIQKGVWPTMITPFNENGKVDFRIIPKLVDWYIEKGCKGIFAVCQSSEMFFLSRREKADIARCVAESAGGRIQVIASGHTADDISQQIDELLEMSQTGVDAVVLVSNRLAARDEDEDIFMRNAERIFSSLKGINLGMYECPYPYKRLLTTAFLEDCAKNEKLVFIKDTCCSSKLIKERIRAVQGYNLSIFNANTATLLDSLRAGGAGYNGVMANFHPEIYHWLYHHFQYDTPQVEWINDFLTVAGVIEARAYPASAKYHMNRLGIPMTANTRVSSPDLLNENAMLEVDRLIDLEQYVKKALHID